MTRLAILTLLVLLVPATSASALIQIDRGIAGVRLGNTPAQVRAALGKPSKVTQGTNDFGPFTRFTYPGKITVFFQGRANVTNVQTAGLGDRTASGIGVGSSEARLKAKVKGLKCERFGSTRICHTNDLLPGRRVTDFRISGGKVVSVSVGLVID